MTFQEILVKFKALFSDLNTGTDDTKFPTSLALASSKYLDQSGSKISATASGTNTYTATVSPAITSLTSKQIFVIWFPAANTGASTLNINGLGAKSLVKNGSSPLVSGDISAGSILLIAYDGTNMQIVGKLSAFPNGTLKVVTTDSSGVAQTTYGYIDLYLAAIDDTAGVKTAAQMNTAYPTATEGNRVRGNAGVYEYFGTFGWVYYTFTVI